MHFRRNGAVQDSFQKPLDGSEGGAEVVGDVGDEAPLIILGALQPFRHAVHRVGQISHLVVGGHRDPVGEVALRKAPRTLVDRPEGAVDREPESQQEREGEQEHDQERNVNDVQDLVRTVLHPFHGEMDDDIAVGPVITRDRSGDAEDRIRKGTEIGAGHIGPVSGGSGVKAGDDVPVPDPFRVHQDVSVAVHDPDLRLQIGRNGTELRICIGEIHAAAFVDGGIGRCDQAGFVVKGPASGPRQIVISETRRKRCHGKEAGSAEKKICQQEFDDQFRFHVLRRSNLYPTPQTVLRAQFPLSLIFSRRRLM